MVTLSKTVTRVLRDLRNLVEQDNHCLRSNFLSNRSSPTDELKLAVAIMCIPLVSVATGRETQA